MATWSERRAAQKAADQVEYDESLRRAEQAKAERSALPPMILPPPPGTPPRSDVVQRPPRTSVGKAGPIIALVGGALLVIGSIMPWATVSSGFGGVSVSGTQGDGKITLVVGAVIALLALLELAQGTNARVLYGIAGAIGAAVGVYDMSKVSDAVGDVTSTFVQASVGTGLYVVAVGGIASVVGALLRR